MSGDDKEPRKGARNRIGRSKGKLSESSPEGSRRAWSESLIEEKLEIESEVMSDLGIQLIDAVRNLSGSGKKIKELLEQGAPVNYQDEFSGATALHHAASYTDMEAVEEIMAQPDVDYLIRDKQGRLASELAGRADNIELAEALIQKEKEQADKKGIVAHLRYDKPIGDESGGENDPTPF